MDDNKEICDSAMNALMAEESFDERDFYAKLRGYAITPSEMITLWEITRDDYLRVGLIERTGDGRFRAKSLQKNKL